MDNPDRIEELLDAVSHRQGRREYPMDTLTRIEELLDMPAAEKRQAMRELQTHCRDVQEELVASRMDAAEAEQHAARRIGDPEEVAQQLNEVHCRAPWRSALLAAAAVVAMAPASWAGRQMTAGNAAGAGVLLLLAAAFGIAAYREIRRGRRPVWLATWLAVGISAAQSLLSLTVHMMVAEPTSQGFLVKTDASPFPLAFAMMAPPVLAVLLVTRHSPKWRRTGIRLSLLMVVSPGIVVALFPKLQMLGALMLSQTYVFPVLNAAVWVLVALRIFGAHPQGHPILGSLFVASGFLVASGMWPPLTVSTLVVLAYARASSWHRKLVILLSGVPLVALTRLIVAPYGSVPLQVAIISGVLLSVTMVLTLAAVVLVPRMARRAA